MTGQHKEYPLFHLVNRLIKEARRNEEVFDEKEFTVERLVRSLSHQAPNRLYCNHEGDILTVLIFSESNRPFESFTQVIRREDDQWQIAKSETISCVDADALELEISWWRRKYQMAIDLVEKPTEILQIVGGPPILDGSFVHIAQIKPGLTLSYYYHLSPVGPRVLAIRLGDNIDTGDAILVPRERPPEDIITYSKPFAPHPTEATET